MHFRRAFTVSLFTLLAMAATTAAFAGGVKNTSTTSKGVGLTAQWWTNTISTTYGVFDDGNDLYENGISGVQCYFGVSGKNLVLVTYNTPRTLHFVFNPSQNAWKASGIPSNFQAVSDFYGVNYYGAYASQGVGTTAEVSASLEFYVGRTTYELNYPALASYRTAANTWLITSSPNDIPGYPGFTASNQATLVLVRRSGNITYGTVNMPIKFEVTTQ